MNLIFDLDGTLLYTLKDLQNSVNFALKKFGFRERTIEEIREAVGDGLRMLMLRSLPSGTEASLADEVLAEMKQHYALHCNDETVPYEGILDLLKRLIDDDHRICIVSNKADSMVQILKQKFFDGLVDFAIGESEQNAKKPSADMVIKAMKLHGADALYIGDSEVDLKTAENASLPCLCVSWGYRSEEALIAAGASTICCSPEELYQEIQRAVP